MLKNSILIFSLFSFSINIFTKTPQQVAIVNDLLLKHKVEGAVLIYNSKTKEYLTNNAVRCNAAYSPASTFKIPNSLIALELEVTNLDTIFRWDGQKKFVETWQANMNLPTAFKVSCVPVYQSIAKMVGLEKMQSYTRLLDFGQMDVNASNLDKFWLEGNSQITQYQQIYFLQRLYQSELPLREDTMEKVRQMMLVEETAEYKLFGKTGWGEHEGKDIGWFVGYMQTTDNVFFFATNIEPTTDTDMSGFSAVRVSITKQVLLNLIK